MAFYGGKGQDICLADYHQSLLSPSFQKYSFAEVLGGRRYRAGGWQRTRGFSLSSTTTHGVAYWAVGEGRVLDCLRDNREQLTEACRNEELKLNIIQARDVRLLPKLRKICSEEMVVFCKDTKAGVDGVSSG